MTEKRFIINDFGSLIDTETDECYMFLSEIEPLINELAEENNNFKETKRFKEMCKRWVDEE